MSSVMNDLAGMEQTKRRLAALYLPIAEDLESCEKIYRTELESSIPFVQRLVDHAARFQGKRLRPTLLLLTAKACGGIRPIHHQLAAVVEMIHTASLVHDDILDEAMVRRHAATINVEWGNESAVLLGDYLFTHAFHLAASTGSTLACQWISRATNRVWEGEMSQNYHRGDLNLDESTYFDIIRGKTAELTAVSAGLGAYFAESDSNVVDAMDSFGRNLGIAFQIVDDLLDILGDERNTGKSLGTDLEKSKLTLPLIRFLARATPEEASELRSVLVDPDRAASRRKAIKTIVSREGIIDDCWRTAREFVNAAQKDLSVLDDSPSKSILSKMTEDVVKRAF